MTRFGLISPNGGSPPSRGAWIEISRTASTLSASDRSPPSRGAWIEIYAVRIRGGL